MPEKQPSFRKGSIDPLEIGHSMPRYTNDSKKVNWKKDEDPSAGRTLQEYLNLLELSTDDVRGKHILDLGSGRDALPAQGLQDIATVISVSPDYAEEKYRSSSDLPPRVAALGETLPFPDESFDMIWMVHVADHFERLYENQNATTPLGQTLHEALRVLKPKGTLYIAPTPFEIRAALNAILAPLERKGAVKISHEKTPFTADFKNYDRGGWDTQEIARIRIVKLTPRKRQPLDLSTQES